MALFVDSLLDVAAEVQGLGELARVTQKSEKSVFVSANSNCISFTVPVGNSAGKSSWVKCRWKSEPPSGDSLDPETNSKSASGLFLVPNSIPSLDKRFFQSRNLPLPSQTFSSPQPG